MVYCPSVITFKDTNIKIKNVKNKITDPIVTDISHSETWIKKNDNIFFPSFRN